MQASTTAVGAVRDADDEILDFTQEQRRKLLLEMTKGGMPSDPKDRAILLNTLDGMDRQAIGKKRLKQEEKTAQGMQAVMAGAIADMLNRASSGGKKPFQVIDAVAREIPTLGADIPRPSTVDGEMEIGDRSLTYETFQQGFVRPEATTTHAVIEEDESE